MIRTYQNDVEKKQVLLRKATATRNELMFITEALRKLLNDENFVTLLRAEGLATIPKNLSDRLATRTGIPLMARSGRSKSINDGV